MAAWRHMKLPFKFTRVFYSANKHMFQVTARDLQLHPALRSSVSSSSSSDESRNIGVTRDGETIVCFHRASDITYELTQPIPSPDPLLSAETHDLVLKSRLNQDILKIQKSPSIEELSKMFFTTKHRWYPVGQFHTRRRNRNPPRDR